MEPVFRSESYAVVSQEVAVPICQCSALVEQCQHLGVEGYRVENYQAAGFLNRYLPISIPHAPMLIYKKDIRIPLVFRRDSHVQMVLNESWRLEAYFRLVDWFLADDFEAEKIVFGYSAACCPLRRFRGLKMIDSAYVAFRLSEIVDGASFALQEMQTEEEFIQWNQERQLVGDPQIGRHSKILDLDNPKHLQQVQLVFDIIRLKYPHVTLFQKASMLDAVG